MPFRKLLPLQDLSPSDRAFIQRICLALSVTLALVLTLEIVAHFVEGHRIQREATSTYLMSTSAQQGILSQRITALALALVTAHSESLRTRVQNALSEEISTMEQLQKQLHKTFDENKSAANISNSLELSFFNGEKNLDTLVSMFLASAHKTTEIEHESVSADNPELQKLIVESSELLTRFQLLATELRSEGVSRVLALQHLSLLIRAVKFFIVLVVALALFVPLIRRLTRELKWRTQTEERLRLANRELDQFASIVAHDLKAPLHNIHAFSEFLAMKSGIEADPESREFIDQIKAAVSRMAGMISDLLRFARATVAESHQTEVILERVVSEALDNCSAEINENGAIVEVSGLPKVKGNHPQLLHLFQNLISNSLKYRHPQRQLRIKIYKQRTDRPAKMCELVVEDNGVGFPIESQEVMFEPFRRLTNASSTEGTGLGLSLCRKIVRQHGGEIRAQPKEDGGARFIFTLRT